MTLRQKITVAMDQIGPRLRARRIELGLLQKDVADRGGFYDARVISDFERGENHPGLFSLMALADALECHIDYLVPIIAKND